MSGTILPVYRWQINYNGSPAAGAKAYFYLSGTSTPHDTYNNADLDPSHANTNPVVADADGVLPIIYLDAVSYRVLITTSTGVTIFPAQDGIYDLFQIFQVTTESANTVYAGPASGSPAAPTFRAIVAADLPSSGTINLADNGLNDFRLSLTTAVPVTTTDVTAATTIYGVPYTGNRIALYDASGVPTYYAGSQMSIAVPATTATGYDVFCFASGGVPTLELTAWTSLTTRATNIVANVASGVYTKSGDATRRYLGSFRTTGVSGQTEDSVAKRYLWNYYHRVSRVLRRIETTDSWTYGTTSYQQANNSTANQVEVFVGVAEVALSLTLVGILNSSSAGGATASVAIGEDSVTAPVSGQIGMPLPLVANVTYTTRATYDGYPAIGNHYYAWLEQGTGAGTDTWYGDNGSPTRFQSGLSGSIQG